MTDSTERAPEVWTYAGARISSKGKKMFAWQDAKGELLYFVKISASAVGGRFQFDVLRSEDGSFSSVYSGSKTYVEAAEKDDELVAGWQMENRLTEAQLARERAERKAKAEPDSFELAIQPLRELRAKSCRTYADRTAFLAMVMDALGH